MITCTTSGFHLTRMSTSRKKKNCVQDTNTVSRQTCQKRKRKKSRRCNVDRTWSMGAATTFCDTKVNKNAGRVTENSLRLKRNKLIALLCARGWIAPKIITTEGLGKTSHTEMLASRFAPGVVLYW